jgi:hypothetical protein
MTKRKVAGTGDARPEALASMEGTLAHGLKLNPDVQTVMDIAMRARAFEDLGVPLEIDYLTEVRATPVSSQGLWQEYPV